MPRGAGDQQESMDAGWHGAVVHQVVAMPLAIAELGIQPPLYRQPVQRNFCAG
jgi:hypothetical protein